MEFPALLVGPPMLVKYTVTGPFGSPVTAETTFSFTICSPFSGSENCGLCPTNLVSPSEGLCKGTPHPSGSGNRGILQQSTVLPGFEPDVAKRATSKYKVVVQLSRNPLCEWPRKTTLTHSYKRKIPKL